jgi:hypothetical protein
MIQKYSILIIEHRGDLATIYTRYQSTYNACNCQDPVSAYHCKHISLVNNPPYPYGECIDRGSTKLSSSLIWLRAGIGLCSVCCRGRGVTRCKHLRRSVQMNQGCLFQTRRSEDQKPAAQRYQAQNIEVSLSPSQASRHRRLLGVARLGVDAQGFKSGVDGRA